MTPELLLLALAAAGFAAALVAVRRRGARLAAVLRTLDRPRGTDPILAAEEAAADREALRADLHRAEAETRRLGDVLACGVMRIEPDLRVAWANPHAHALLGRPPGAIEGRSVIGAFADHRVEALVRAALAPAAGAAIRPLEPIQPLAPLEAEVTLREPPHRVLAIRAAPISSGGAWLVVDDRTQLRRLERIRVEFLDNLSHELRTPLTNIRLLTESLDRTLDADTASDRVRDAIRRIDVESGHLVQMVTEVLDLARIEEGTPRLMLSEVDLGDLARSCAERLATFAQHQQVTLRVDLPADLPLVRGDEGRLGQLLLNLLHNAVKFSRAGGEVVVSGEARGPQVLVSVTDNGAGIPRSDLDRIFERFYKADRARHRGTGGTGLGLTIARHIAESHGGQITVVSEEGEGSTFSVTLPVDGPAVPPGERGSTGEP